MRQHEEELLAHDAELDRRERLLEGPCDLCQEPCSLGLVEVGGEALCVECVGAVGLDYSEAVEQARAPGDVEDPWL